MQIFDLLARKSPIYERLNVNSDWIDLEFMERTPQQAVKLGIQMHVAGLSLSNTVAALESLGVKKSEISERTKIFDFRRVECSRKAVHDWVHKADLQPDDGRSPDHVAIDETVIRINDKQFWLYAAVNPQNNHLLHVQLFHSTTTVATRMFLRELAEKHDIENSLFLVDGAQHLQTALRRSGLRFRYVKYGDRNSAERVFRELKRRTQAFSNCFSNAQPETAEEWLVACFRFFPQC